MKFVDSIEIIVASGHGGAGLVSFRAGKNRPKLGCDGGDGGHGGDVYLLGTSQLSTLSALYYKRVYAAGHGGRGGTNGKTGKNGEDMIIPVALGTIAYNQDTGEKICEVLEEGEKIMIAEGGKRGIGNLRYLSATHQAPEEYTKGGSGAEINLRLELKLIADAGFAGFPNAGKSTLLSRISAAKPKIADYPFTTLVPNLGVVNFADEGDLSGKSFVAADIPGLIEGASEGKGLGHEFLRHLERTKVIVYLVDAFSVEGIDPFDAFLKLKAELKNYSSDLAAKRSLVVVTKADLAPEGFDWESLLKPIREASADVLKISAVQGEGIKELKFRLFDIVMEEKEKIVVEETAHSARDSEFEFYTRAGEDSLLGL